MTSEPEITEAEAAEADEVTEAEPGEEDEFSEDDALEATRRVTEGDEMSEADEA
ncbi:hypothetical protein QEZ54_06785 [Catellatospora sp. KI3]|uniref:hypothetical protein n=1 Tax=Catellatospora sp. KI3 TaxID=3041620 RepID=UPI002482301E|nr:hypothetical protein [Catellatospora sp. KI3]MDI1460664.1 hypothetical protein [Catellatospora sp. KI3]